MLRAPDPLTVVIVLDHASVTGGQARVAFDSAIGLKRAGHESIVFAAVGPVAPELVAAGVRTVCLGQADLLGHRSIAAAAVQGVWNGAAADALRELLATLPAGRSVIHVHGWAKALSPAIARPIAESGLPAVYTLHEYSLMCPNGGFFNYRTETPCSLKPLGAACLATHCDSRGYSRKLWRAARHAVMERVARLPAAFPDIVAISRFQVAAVSRHLPAGARVHLVSNPIGVEPMGPKPAGARGPLTFVGRISPEKGPLLFAEAARRAGVDALFVGDGPLLPELKRRYPEVRTVGWQGPEAVQRYLREAGALVFPSIWYEGQPLTVLEAKALGTPVIVSDGCAGRDCIADGVDGLWFRRNDADNLAQAIRRFGEADVDALSRAAYDSYWAAPATLERHVAAIVALYRGLLPAAAELRLTA
ncbi:glycosyltransferase family 4 protein [Lichenibacterium dinghuense]|uniref:glycosyltransferase family 4 protein n=1 Tax=Lichenibacterium dinghuense TaxID=2895977 RepID=UPI001F31018F|nr:glycosyltransferase family 4 protein [Lichenibacterium sp. 6Y81]